MCVCVCVDNPREGAPRGLRVREPALCLVVLWWGFLFFNRPVAETLQEEQSLFACAFTIAVPFEFDAGMFTGL